MFYSVPTFFEFLENPLSSGYAIPNVYHDSKECQGVALELKNQLDAARTALS